VHRDLKPDNIMLAADGPRVIDFGIARAVESTSVTASGVIGTIGYMAPEQLEGMRLTSAVDLFSWGAVMVFAATGREAFPGPTQAARIAKVLSGNADLDGLPESLAPAVRACLSGDPGARPDARTLLDHLVTGGPLPAQAPTTAEPKVEPTLVEGVDDGLTRGYEPGSAAGAEPGPSAGPEHRAPSGGAYTPPSSGPQSPPPSGSGSHSPPYHFAGKRLHTVEELAAALQENWPDAVKVMSDDQERAALGAWIIDDLNDTLVDRALFRRTVNDANAAVATVIAQARPDLPPVFRGHDCSIAGLGRLFSDPRPLLSGDPRSNELGLLARPQVLRLMAQHEGPDSGVLRSLAEDLVEAERIGVRFHEQLARGLGGWRGTQNHVDPAVALVFLLHPDLVRRPDPGDRPGVAEWVDILWTRVERSEGAARAGHAAAVYGALETVAVLAHQREQWISQHRSVAVQQRQLADQGDSDEGMRRGKVLLYWLTGIFAFIALVTSDVASFVFVVFALGTGIGGAVVANQHTRRYGTAQERQWRSQRAAQLPRVRSSLDSGLQNIERDLAEARRICSSG
ncbi:protein kinase, partial [Nocardiopsis sp. HNM0947]